MVPAFVRLRGIPRQPVSVEHARRQGVNWRVVEVLAHERGGTYNGEEVEETYRLEVFGPLPYRPDQDGPFVMVVRNFAHRTFWWLFPEPPPT